MAKHKQIFCKCGQPANWYKKGKGHRVLVCSSCGIIANNPIPLAAIAAAAPYIIEGASQVGNMFSKKQISTTPPAAMYGGKRTLMDRAIELEQLEEYKPKRRKYGKQSKSYKSCC